MTPRKVKKEKLRAPSVVREEPTAPDEPYVAPDQVPSGGDSDAVEVALADAGVDLEVARGSLVDLSKLFPKGIPDGTLDRWAAMNFPQAVYRRLVLTLGRAWEGSSGKGKG